MGSQLSQVVVSNVCTWTHTWTGQLLMAFCGDTIWEIHKLSKEVPGELQE